MNGIVALNDTVSTTKRTANLAQHSIRAIIAGRASWWWWAVVEGTHKKGQPQRIGVKWVDFKRIGAGIGGEHARVVHGKGRAQGTRQRRLIAARVEAAWCCGRLPLTIDRIIVHIIQRAGGPPSQALASGSSSLPASVSHMGTTPQPGHQWLRQQPQRRRRPPTAPLGRRLRPCWCSAGSKPARAEALWRWDARQG